MKTQGDIQHELNQRIKQLEAQLAELREKTIRECTSAVTDLFLQRRKDETIDPYPEEIRDAVLALLDKKPSGAIYECNNGDD